MDRHVVPGGFVGCWVVCVCSWWVVVNWACIWVQGVGHIVCLPSHFATAWPWNVFSSVKSSHLGIVC